jgi:zinc-ribbon domain
VTDAVRTCPSCHLAVQEDARFCPNCGTQLEGDAAPAAGEGPQEVSYTQVPPRLFGVLAPLPTFVLATILLAGALISLVAQSWVLGVLLLAFSAALYVLFYGAAERDPSSGVAKAALSLVGRISGWARFATGSASAWSGAGRRVYDIRRELGPLRRERREAVAALGDAAYRQDETTVASLRARIAEIDDAIATRESEREEALANARKRVEDERLEVRETQFMPPDDADEAGSAKPS